MVILERTPPRKWHQSPEEGDGSINNGERSENLIKHNNVIAPRKSFVFPSLEDMAAPIREQRAATIQQQINGVSSTTSSATKKSPIIEKDNSPLKQHSQLSKIPISRSIRTSTSPRKASVSPTLSRQRVSPSRTNITQDAAVDAAFQQQIERAIALGENPFMDKRRAAMRDDSNTSMDTSLPHTQPATNSIYPSLPSQRASIGRDSNETVEETRSQKQDEIPHRSEEEVQRAVATIRRSLLGDKSQHDSPSGSTQKPLQALPSQDSPKRPPSPPLAQFTPQKRMLTREAHAVPIIQQEELHRLRNELRECKSQLRESQLKVENLQKDHQESQAQFDTEKRKNQTVEAQLNHIKLVSLQNECNYKELEANSSKVALMDRISKDEESRQNAIKTISLQNEIVRLKSEKREIMKKVQKLKVKQNDEDESLRRENTRLTEKLQKARSEREDVLEDLRKLQSETERKNEDEDDFAERIERLENSLATEKARRKEISVREANLLGEVQELQEVAAREGKLRAEVAELRAELYAEREAHDDLRARTAAMKKARSSQQHSPSRTLKHASSSSISKSKEVRHKPVMEANLSEDEWAREEDVIPSPIQMSKRSKESAHSKGKVVSKPVEERSPVRKSTKDSKLTTRNAPIINQPVVEDFDDEDFDEKIVHQPEPASFLPAKTNSKSVLAKARINSSKNVPATSSSTRTNIDSTKTKSSTKERSSAPAYDETMKTPLLPSKRTRAIQNKQPEPEPEFEEEEDERSLSTLEIVQAAKKATSKPSKIVSKAKTISHLIPSENDENDHSFTAKTPMVTKINKSNNAVPTNNNATSIVEPKKKKRKLLKPGSNVAGDFLNWKGDADGGLNPQLNLPMELSPLKPGEEGNNKVRLGTGVGVGAQKIFGRK